MSGNATSAGIIVLLLASAVACSREQPVEGPGVMQITSSAFAPGETIPTRHTGEGEDVSPPLAWSNVPPGARQLVLVVDDPDAPREEPWVHWVLYGLAPDVSGLSAGDAGGGIEGVNDFGKPGWGGPMPPPGHGVHRYRFRLYALDGALSLPPGLAKHDVLKAVDGKVLAEAELVGTYERP